MHPSYTSYIYIQMLISCVLLSLNYMASAHYLRYARACSSYGCFILRATRLSNKLLEQGYVKERLKSSLGKFYGRYRDLIKQYEVSLSQMLNDILLTDHIQWQPPLIRLCTELDLLPNFEWFPGQIFFLRDTLSNPWRYFKIRSIKLYKKVMRDNT